MIFKNQYGWIPEWPKGTDCKSAANCFGGSNPPPPILHMRSVAVRQLTTYRSVTCFVCYLSHHPDYVRMIHISRGGAVWKLVGLITRRSQVQILSPQLYYRVSAPIGQSEIARCPLIQLDTLYVGICAHRPIRDCPMSVDHQMVLNEKIEKCILMNASIQRIPF